MLYENTGLAAAIGSRTLPPTLSDLFGDLYDQSNSRFLMQETTIIDFKESIPESFTDSYGVGIVRLALAFHNTYGGVIVFGVVDRTFSTVPTSEIFNIEAFNRMLSDVTGAQIECVLRRYPVNPEDAELPVQVVLVPPRVQGKPVKLTRDLGKYSSGTLWLRDRHEVLEAESRHLPLLYGDRSEFFSKATGRNSRIHKSLPPSPATMEEFIGRFHLMDGLWEWFTSSSQPRLYLHGPGGSGKSTLAYQFATSILDAPVTVKIGADLPVDYVIFLSSKETAFNPLTLADSPYLMRDFSTPDEQFGQIVYNSGFISEADVGKITRDQVDICLDELFLNFTGLIVIDDIDALSRKGYDTGEEALFLRAAQSGGRVKILYTLRYAPPYAISTSKEVPSLQFESEYFSFLQSCCAQFELQQPSADLAIKIFEQSAGLPLLIETIVGLRRTCSNYQEALTSYQSREGDAARRYLYQREYDRLEVRGKAKHVLAALALIDSAVTFTTIANVTSLSEAQVRDAITETRAIFLKSSQAEGGETLYDIATPAFNFIANTSKALPFYPALEKAVRHFKQQSVRTTPHEAGIIFNFTRLAREGDFPRIAEEGALIPPHDSIWGNPKFLGLLGQGYASLGGAKAEDARECFRRAFALHNRDIFMLRAWYRLEFLASHTIQDAEKLCVKLLDEDQLPPRYKSEFYSKLGQVLEALARPHVYTNPERAVDFLKRSVGAYFEGIWLSRNIGGMDVNLQMEWLNQAMRKFFAVLRNDLSPIFDVLESLVDTGHDVEISAASTIIDPLKQLAVVIKQPEAARMAGLARRSLSRISRSKKSLINQSGFAYVLSELQEIVNVIDGQIKSGAH